MPSAPRPTPGSQTSSEPRDARDRGPKGPHRIETRKSGPPLSAPAPGSGDGAPPAGCPRAANRWPPVPPAAGRGVGHAHRRCQGHRAGGLRVRRARGALPQPASSLRPRRAPHRAAAPHPTRRQPAAPPSRHPPPATGAFVARPRHRPIGRLASAATARKPPRIPMIQSGSMERTEPRAHPPGTGRGCVWPPRPTLRRRTPPDDRTGPAIASAPIRGVRWSARRRVARTPTGIRSPEGRRAGETTPAWSPLRSPEARRP